MRRFLVLPLAVLLALEVYHCAKRNGRRFAATFFAAAIAFGVIRANAIGYIVFFYDAPMPYIIDEEALRLGFASAVEVFGWAFALYGSWYLGEGILRKALGRAPGILAVSFMSAVFMGGFSYAVEAAATPMGWWRWHLSTASSPYVYSVPVVGVFDWASAAVDFLLPFLLIECSVLGRSKWSILFAGIIIPHMATHLFPVELPRLLQIFDIWHWVSVWAIGAVALFWDIPFSPPHGRERAASLWDEEGGAVFNALPAVSILGMLAIVLYAIVGVSGDMKLLFSVLPLLTGLVLLAPGIPVWLAAAVLVAASAAHTWFLPALFIPASVLLYTAVVFDGRRASGRGLAVALATAGLVVYYPWAHARSRCVASLADSARAVERVWEAGDHHAAIEKSWDMYGLVAKSAGGEGILAVVLKSSWSLRDKEHFDRAAKEIRSLGAGFEGVELLWDVTDESTFNKTLAEIRRPGRKKSNAPNPSGNKGGPH